MSAGFDADLLVVGLGPAGDVLTALARLHGLSVIAIDRAADVYPLPRAAVFDHEIMRIFQMLGVADDIAPLCRRMERYQFRTAGGEVLLDFALRATHGVSGWAESYALHQPAVEACLRARLGTLGAGLRLNTSFVALRQDATGVTTTVRDGDGDQLLRTRFVIGCDGAASEVRAAVGVRLDDYRFDEPWLVLDTIADQPVELPSVALQICDPRQPVTFMPMGAARYRWEFMVKPGEAPADMLEPARIRALLAPWIDLDRVRVERKAVYRFHALVAEQWRVGRVLLAGDAAHQMPPFAGQGMCSSIRDSANLAWKLALVISGQAGETLLDSYQIEREPHVRSIVETAIAMGRVVCILDEAAAAGRDAEMLARKAAGATDISLEMPPLTGGILADTAAAGQFLPQLLVDGMRLDDALGRAPWLIGSSLPRRPTDTVRFYSLDDPAVQPFAAGLAAWLAQHGAPAVLVRPDRVIFGTGDAAMLLDRWQAMVRHWPDHMPAAA